MQVMISLTEWPIICAISLKVVYTRDTVSGAGWNIVLWFERLPSATIPISPTFCTSVFNWASVRPVHCAIAFKRFVSATPKIIPKIVAMITISGFPYFSNFY